ncbi:MAG: adenosine deaminase [bacterium]
MPYDELPAQLFNQIPKIDLHLHLEGAISPECLLELAKRNGRQDEVPSLKAAQSLMRFSTPQEFFRRFLYVSNFVASVEDLRRVGDDVLDRLACDGVVYSEITIAPRKFLRKGIPYPSLIAELEEAAHQSQCRGGPEVRFIMDIVRDLGPDRGLELVELMERYPSPLVVGVGLGGTEGYPPELSARPFARAREIGLHLTVHAGEGAGPPSIWGAIQRLHAERIDHGTRAREDPGLVDYLAEHRIPLNICPTSNVLLGVVPRLENHPVLDYHRAGILVTIGTDDPSFFGTSLTGEIQSIVRAFHIDGQTIVDLERNAVQASFLSPEEKDRLWERMEGEFARLFPSV